MKRLALFATLAFVVVACHVGENTSETVIVAAPTVPENRTCKSPFVLPDLTKLKACGDGRGHCYAAAKTSISAKDVPACDGDDICVPDKVLLANGKKLKACKFQGGSLAGACTSLLLSELNQHKNEVAQDVCDNDERCTPCLDPRTNENTGTCDESGVHVSACSGGEGTAGESCCHAAGVCMDREALPEDSRDDLERDTCSKGSQVCAPLAFSDGVPTKCDLVGLSGVCIDACFAQILQGAQRTARSGCGPTELCLPCVIGEGKGLPGCD